MSGCHITAHAASLICGTEINLDLDQSKNEPELRAELERYHPDAFGWALQCCNYQADEAEDVLQQTYIKVLTGKAVFSGRSSFRTWLFGVIRLTAASERRRNWLRRLVMARRQDDVPAPAPAQSPRDAAHATSLAQLLRQQLALLPLRQQQMMHLVFYQDMTINEAADTLGISIGSARQHYDRAKQKLRNSPIFTEDNHGTR